MVILKGRLCTTIILRFVYIRTKLDKEGAQIKSFLLYIYTTTSYQDQHSLQWPYSFIKLLPSRHAIQFLGLLSINIPLYFQNYNNLYKTIAYYYKHNYSNAIANPPSDAPFNFIALLVELCLIVFKEVYYSRLLPSIVFKVETSLQPKSLRVSLLNSNPSINLMLTSYILLEEVRRVL